MADSYNPPAACLGRARVGNRWAYGFSLLTLSFSGAITLSNPLVAKKFRWTHKFVCVTLQGSPPIGVALTSRGFVPRLTPLRRLPGVVAFANVDPQLAA